MHSTWYQRISTVLVFPIFCISILAGCSGVNTHRLTGITITPASASIAAGATKQFKATGAFIDGSSSDITTTVTWSSGATSVATISSAGLATGVAAGSSTITATMTGINGTATLAVTSAPATLTSIAITPNPAGVGIGGTVQLIATGTYSNSTSAGISSQVTWSSANTSVATIVPNTGLATGIAVGTSSITAALRGITSPADVLTVGTLQSITISPSSPTIAVGSTADFTATGHFSDGTTQPLTGVTWSSGRPLAAIVTTNGVAVAQAAGTSTITATVNSIPATTTLTVLPAVARFAYVSGSGDNSTATYVVRPASASLLPIGSSIVSDFPTQTIPEPSGRFVYLLAGNGIAAEPIDLTGHPTGPGVKLNTGIFANQGVVDPTGQYLYVASSSSGGTSLNSYSINLTDGSLTAIDSGISFTNIISVITDRAGKFVYAVDNGANAVFAFSIGLGGSLSALSTPSFATSTSPQYPAIDPSNTHLYIPNLAGSVSAYTIGTDGLLTPVTGSPFTAGIGVGPVYAAVDATGKYLYVTNSDPTDNSISGLSIGVGGVLGAAVPGSPFPAGVTPFGIAIDPSNSTVAVANLSSNSISMYTLNAATGALTPATLPQVESPLFPIFINFGVGTTSPTVNPGAVFAANSVSGDISAFTSASSTGVFSAAANSPFAGIPGNSFATADQRGSIFFTGSATGTQVAAFSVNQSTGALTGLTGSPLTVTGTDLGSAVYIAPTDSFAYTLDVTTGSLVENALNGTTISGPGTSTMAFTGANNIAADPQGDIIYALGLNATNGIQPFVISPVDGSLTQSTQSPALPGNWTSGSVDASGQFFVAVDSAAKTLKSFSITPVGTGSGSDGILAPLAAGSVSLTGAGPWVVALDPQDRVVFVADQTAGTITIYPFTASTGALGTAGTVTNVSTNGLTQISTDATGTYLYAGVRAAVAPGSAGAVAVYKIGVAGALAAVAGSPFGTGTGNPGIAATNVVQ
jgi:6-phosphogluconolactonase (cycloisomerase 2 family)/uncharacterized protein YjdB